MISRFAKTGSLDLPPARLRIGITGHRDGNATFAANRADIQTSLQSLFALADAITLQQPDQYSNTRLVSPFAQGTDLMAIELAFGRQWDVTAPLPFGFDLNVAINGHDGGADETIAILEGRTPTAKKARSSIAHLREMRTKVNCFELAEQDELIRQLYLNTLNNPKDRAAANAFAAITSERASAAARVMIEQSDLIIAVWDGATFGFTGGTHHTMMKALYAGIPVLWIDAAAPAQRYLIDNPEALLTRSESLLPLSDAQISAFLGEVIRPLMSDNNERAAALHTEHWHDRSRKRFHIYRRVEAIFSGSAKRAFAGLRQYYESPEDIADGSAADLVANAGELLDPAHPLLGDLKIQILRRFAWADGLSTFLSDAYRSGMVANFLLGALAIIVGAAYLPLVGPELKWPFAFTEFLLLICILLITSIGRRQNWHARWFQTRRVAEYLRHAPILLLLGVARPAGQWPRSKDTEWPEYYCKRLITGIGLPAAIVTQEYLRSALEKLVQKHAREQREYHQGKAALLTKVHHNLDKISEVAFLLAVIAVACYLLLAAGQAAGLVPATLLHGSSKIFTFLGIALPAIGGAFAGIRYFGDFERFAAISEITAERLAGVEQRIALLLAAKESQLRFIQVADLVHNIDDIVVSEIENWQSVFANKQIAVPV